MYIFTFFVLFPSFLVNYCPCLLGHVIMLFIPLILIGIRCLCFYQSPNILEEINKHSSIFCGKNCFFFYLREGRINFCRQNHWWYRWQYSSLKIYILVKWIIILTCDIHNVCLLLLFNFYNNVVSWTNEIFPIFTFLCIAMVSVSAQPIV